MTSQSTVREAVLHDPAQLAALGHPVRARILTALESTPSSAKRLAEQLEMTHGKVGHHLHVLADAGLVEVVETRQVRAMTEKVYGPTYDRIRIDLGGGARELQFFFRQVVAHVAPVDQPLAEHRRFYTRRLEPDAATAVANRLAAIADDVAAMPDAGDDGRTVGVAVAVFDVDDPS